MYVISLIQTTGLLLTQTDVQLYLAIIESHLVVTGIGVIPNAVLSKLGDHRDLGIHTEMFSDGVIDLVEKGVITNAQKTLHTGKIVSSFAYGSKRLYEFMHDNPLVCA